MKNIALIPARCGSKGVPNKNIKLLGDTPLIAYSILTALSSEFIDRVIVTTDSEEIAIIAEKYGAEVPFIRPSEFAQDDSTDFDFINHFINWLTLDENYNIILLRPTTPLRDSAVIDCAIKIFENAPIATSLRSAHLCSESPFKWFLKKGDYFTGINTGDMDIINGPRQNFPDVYVPNGYVDIINSSIVWNGRIYGANVLAYETPVAHEVDTLDDFKLLEYEVKQCQDSDSH